MQRMEVLFTPADFENLRSRDITKATCVVFDVLRATSSMIAGLANGAAEILPVQDIPEALQAKVQDATVLLAGERDGFRISAALANGTEFDLGNSPREFTTDRVKGKVLVMTTTNGTRALRACAGAAQVLVGSFLNLSATISLVEAQPTDELLLVCGGTFEEAAYEDTLCAGAIADLLWRECTAVGRADSAFMARQLYLAARNDLTAALAAGKNGRRLLGREELKDDVAYCARMNALPIAATMVNGRVRVAPSRAV